MKIPRLGKCEVCGKEDAKYCCPQCEVKTCCLKCVNIHKKELDCSGIRSRVKFKTIKGFTNMDLLNDYRLLEEVGRNVERYSKDKRIHGGSFYELPLTLYRLRAASLKRNTEIHFLPKHFKRRKENTTFLNYVTQELFWRVEWEFPQADSIKFIDERVLDTERLGSTLDKYMIPTDNDNKALSYYQSTGYSGIVILLKAENVPGERYFEMDPLLSWRDNLQQKAIIEFPTLIVVLKEHKQCYNIITPDEEDEIYELLKTESEKKKMDKLQNIKQRRTPVSKRNSSVAKRNREFRNNFFFSNDKNNAYANHNKSIESNEDTSASNSTNDYVNGSYNNGHCSSTSLNIPS